MGILRKGKHIVEFTAVAGLFCGSIKMDRELLLRILPSHLPVT